MFHSRLRCLCRWLPILAILFVLPFTATPGLAIEKPGDALQEVGVSPTLGTKVDLSLRFTNSDGAPVTLGDYAKKGRPLVITPVYYSCPRLCGLLLSGATTLFNEMNLKLGEEYEVVTVSFDSTEKSDLAKKRATEYRQKLTREGADADSWHFIVGEEDSVHPLMEQLGFRYKRDGQDFAHSAAIIILTPEGEISQYFTGIDFSAWDVRLALIGASQGGIGSLIDHVLLFCFRYDHLQGKYTWAAFNFVRVGAIVTMLALGAAVFISARRRVS